MIESISAVALATRDMGHAVRFYASIGFGILYGGEASSFTSLRAGPGCRVAVNEGLIRFTLGATGGLGGIVFGDGGPDMMKAVLTKPRGDFLGVAAISENLRGNAVFNTPAVGWRRTALRRAPKVNQTLINGNATPAPHDLARTHRRLLLT